MPLWVRVFTWLHLLLLQQVRRHHNTPQDNSRSIEMHTNQEEHDPTDTSPLLSSHPSSSLTPDLSQHSLEASSETSFSPSPLTSIQNDSSSEIPSQNSSDDPQFNTTDIPPEETSQEPLSREQLRQLLLESAQMRMRKG